MQDKKISRRAGMRATSDNKQCTVTFSSATSAMKAQSILSMSGVHVSVVKTSSSRRDNGCAFGISYACTDDEEIRRILGSHGMSAEIVNRAK